MAGQQCCTNPPELNPSFGSGKVVEDFGGLKTYTSGAPDAKQAVLLISDIFGFEAPKLRKIADKVAAAGFYVIVPDFFQGDFFDINNTERPVPVWLSAHPIDKSYEDAKKVIAEVKKRGISTIGAAGFCWGAKLVVELSKSADDIQAAVLLHPSLVTTDDVKEVKCPISFLLAEIDRITPPELVEKFKEVLSSKSEVPSFVKIFPGVGHGWSVRYEDDDQVAVQKATEAENDLLDWFLNKLK